jgi:GxxExxY protein
MLVERKLTGVVVEAAIEVHRALGPGLLESAYRLCLAHQLRESGIHVQSETPIALNFKGLEVPTAFRADLIVDERVMVELKAVDRLLPVHESQLLTYLKLARLKVGLLINFNVPRLQLGIRRYVR